MLDILSLWTDWLYLEGRSKDTIAGYTWEVRKLIAHYPDKRVDDYTREDLIAFLAWRRQTCGDAAINRAVCGLKAFFKFARPGRSPAEGIPVPRPKKRAKRTLTHQQAFTVMAGCDTSRPRGVRDLALIALMLDTGLRAAEVCRLELRAVDLEHCTFTVTVKGGQEKNGVFSQETAAFLAAWIPVRETVALSETKTLFTSVGGLKPGCPLTTDGLRRIFHCIGRAAGLDYFSPHDLRRTFATLATLMGAPVRLIQLAGRWDDINQVVHYTRALQAKDFAPYSPVSGLMRDWFERDGKP